MNYLNLVNNVLRRLREDEVTSVSDSVYATMIGDIVNDAKRQVEDAWNWTALRTTITVPTVASTQTYSLTDSAHRASITDATNDTSNWWMRKESQQWMRRQALVRTSPNGAPFAYSVEAPDSNGDTQVKLYPTPDAVYSLSFNVVQREADLSDDADTSSVPHMPVIHLAVAMAASEKGETGGMASQELYGMAKRSLADAISRDAGFVETDTVWYPV